MNQSDSRKNNVQPEALEDLAVPVADAIQGGPKRIFIGGLSVESAGPDDPVPTGAVGGMLPSAATTSFKPGKELAP